MVSSRLFCGLSTVVALVNGQALLQKAVGDSGQSQSLLVDLKNPKDANLIAQQEIVTNIVNECGRTLLAGNIDIGEQTEIALSAGQVTKSKKGGKVTVTINQVNAQGSGPFECDMDLTSNSNGAVGQTKLKVTQNKAEFGNGVMTLQVDMPADMACIGASTGDVCTVRCRNKQEFGGCFAVQQTDTKASANTPGNIVTASTLDQVNKQVAQDIKDFEVSVNAIAGSQLNDQGTAVADALVKNNANVLKGNNGNAGNAGNAGNNNNNGGAGRGGNNNNGGAGRGGNANAGGNGAGRGGNANAGGNGAGAGAGAGAGRGGNANAGAGAGAGRGGNANAGAGAGAGAGRGGNNANAGNANGNGAAAGRGGNNNNAGGNNAANGNAAAGRGGNNNNNRKRSTLAMRRSAA